MIPNVLCLFFFVIYSTALPTWGQNTWSQTRIIFRTWNWVKAQGPSESTLAKKRYTSMLYRSTRSAVCFLFVCASLFSGL